MKIAFVYDVVYPYVKGGVEKRIWELSTRLAARGHDVHIYSMKFWDGDETHVLDGVTVHGVCPAKKLYCNGRRTLTEALYFAIHLTRPLAKEPFDIIDCQQFPFLPCIPARFISLFRRIPLVITWHEVWGRYWMEYLGARGWFGKIIERYVASFRSPVIAVSKTTADRFTCSFGRQPDIIIPNGIDLSTIASVAPSGRSSDLIFVGRLIREKNVGMLIDAFRILVSETPSLKLMIVGDGPERNEIQAQIEKLSLGGNIIMTGFIEEQGDVIALMKSSKVFVLPSIREGFGIAALEALGCGLPVVTISHPANAVGDLLSDGTGVICSPNPKDLAEGIRDTLSRHEQMQDACIAAAEAYDWDRIAQQAADYYQSVINSYSTVPHL